MTDYRLVLLIRNDLPSMNPGKACAQASHASNQFVWDVERPENEQYLMDYTQWANETSSGFGTCIVLGADEDQIKTALVQAQHDGLLCGEVIDPTYPFMDGKVCHLISLMTCAYVFCTKDQGWLALKGLQLMH